MQATQQRDIPAPLENEYRVAAWGIPKDGDKITPFWINRWNVGDNDVKIKMLYCGICHSDVHSGKNDFKSTIFPNVAGHELVGVVEEVGTKVTKVKVGDNVGVGTLVDSCADCQNCKLGDEQYCNNGYVGTYNGTKKHSHVGGNKETQTFGGYSSYHVCYEHFVFKLPDGMPLDKAGPLMCAGTTMYDPLRHWGATKGDRKMCIGIVGVGGLGTMGIKLAKALGHRVVAVSRTKDKEAIAKEKGADVLVASTDPESMKTEMGKCDLILNTVSANHDVNTYIPLLNKSGTIVQIGAALAPHSISQIPFMVNRLSFAGSIVGGVKSTEEMLAFCQEKKIYPDCETVNANKIQWAWDILADNKDAIRYVLDIQASLKDESFIPKAEQ